MGHAASYGADMDCSVVHDALMSGDLADPSVEAHVASCAGCTELVAERGAVGEALATMARGVHSDAPAPPWREELATVLAAESRGAPRRWPTWAKGGSVVLLSSLFALAVAMGQPRPDWASVPAPRMALVLLGLAGAGWAGAGMALRPSHLPERPGWWGRWVWAAVALVPALLMALPPAHDGEPGSSPATMALCFGIASAFALMGVGAFRGLDRRRSLSVWRAASYAGVGAVLGNVYLQLHCPYTGVMHTLGSHGLVGGLWMVALGLWHLSRRR